MKKDSINKLFKYLYPFYIGKGNGKNCKFQKHAEKLRSIIKALNFQSWGPEFKTTWWLHGRLSLSSF